MANKLHSRVTPLSTVYIIVLGAIIVTALLAQSFSLIKPPTQMRTETKPLPPQTLNEGGHKSTVLSFSPTSSTETPLIKSVGDTVTLDFMVDPGQNLVSFIKVEILYDATKLTPIGTNAFKADGALASLLDGPTYRRGKIAATMSVGADPTRAISKPAKAASVTFRTIAPTRTSTPTLVTFGSTTNVLSLASQDNASENVLSSTLPAVIVVSE